MEFSRALIELIELKDVLGTTGRFISETLHIERIAILLYDEEEEGYVTRYEENVKEELKIRPNSGLIRSGGSDQQGEVGPVRDAPARINPQRPQPPVKSLEGI